MQLGDLVGCLERYLGSAAFGRSGGRAMVVAGALVLAATGHLPAQTPDSGPAAWRVECTGDGKTLDCRAVQQIFQRSPNQQQPVSLATIVARYAPDTKAAAIQILLPLGLNLTEPVLIKVDNGAPERQSIQTCNNAGCLVTMTASDRFLAAMRAGTDLKITVQDASKKPIELSLPLLGFGVAFDKTK
jgi:invasion protein IalB